MTAPTDFLLARISEDRVRATMREQHAYTCGLIPQAGSEYTYPCDCGVPERMLAECEAKARIVGLYMGARRVGDHLTDPDDRHLAESMTSAYEGVLRVLALPYSSHPDYREVWRP